MAGVLATMTYVEERFNQTAAINYMLDVRHYSVYISAFYVFTIFGIQKFMKNRPKYNLRGPLMVWSLALCVFSFCGFWNVGLFHLRYLVERGWKGSVCDPLLVQKHVSLWSWLFCISKLPELIDTYFIVLRKQKLIFLHWYHHITVFVYCWYSYGEITNPQQWFVTMNYFVHSIMYLYFTIRASSIYRPPMWVNMFITSLQLLQMMVGVWVNLYVFLNMRYTPGWYCDGKVETTYVYVGSAFAMYASYFVLFVNFFYSVYFSKGSASKKTSPQSRTTAEAARHNTWVSANGTLVNSIPTDKLDLTDQVRPRNGRN